MIIGTSPNRASQPIFVESGVDLRYIQELLEHLSASNAQVDKSSKTTEIYTHVSKRNLTYIRNPLDSLVKTQKRD